LDLSRLISDLSRLISKAVDRKSKLAFCRIIAMMKHSRTTLWFIIIITAIAIFFDFPKTHVKIDRGPIKVDTDIGGYNLDINLLGVRIKRNLEIKRGLDLQGGLAVTLQADMSEINEADRNIALESAKNVIERRVNFFGVTEPNIYTSQVSNNYRVIVELPGVTETMEALQLIGQTAQLDFRETATAETAEEFAEGAEGFVKTDLTGKDLKRAQVVFAPTTGQPQVALTFADEGAKKFEEITRRNVEKPLAIYLDEVLLTAPRVQQVISEGEAVISGQFSLDDAKRLAIQLNAGALPVPITILLQRNIGPTLGAESVQKSIRAGLVGLSLVAIFMIGYYKRLGFLAVIALIIYGLITLFLYKFIPVTLTLAGIAGFILSVGMAVDSNILIFERIKEELKIGRPLKAAMELGFGRAWDSIRDANVATLITVFILFNPFHWSFLATSGMVRGFALTLGLGIATSLFTGIVVTRTLVRVFYKS